MSFAPARIQTVEEIYRLLCEAAVGRYPIAALYHRQQRFFCPHRLGKNKAGSLRVLAYQYAGDSQSGLDNPGSENNWRCLAVEKLSRVEALSASAWRTGPNHSKPQTCISDVDVDAADFE